ncbi:hypothetical protein, partial [Gloeocapsa sp. PCC 73106]|uniref:hypothetical protein n=1 Tax=Gloeocapsa sp. PCC 73106 TaxID=102232 RepID=UPI001930976D
LDGSNRDTSAFSDVKRGGVGNAGDVEVKASSLEVVSGATVSARTFGQGDAGNVLIEVTGAVKLDRRNRFVFTGVVNTVSSGAVGDAKVVEIRADSVEVLNGALIDSSTLSRGNGGTVLVEADGLVKFDRGESELFPTGAFSLVLEGAVGNAGDVKIRANSLELTNRAQASAAVFGVGNGGNVEIRANSVEITNSAFIGASTFGEGDAGRVVIEADGLVRFDARGRKDENNSTGAFSIVGSFEGENAVGNAGGVRIKADSVEILNGAIVGVGTFGEGDAGRVVIEANSLVRFDGGDTEVETTGPGSDVRMGAVGDSGGVEIRAHTVEVLNGAAVRANTNGRGNAGTIVIEADGLVKLDRGDSDIDTGIFSRVNSGAVGNAGGVEIRANSLEVINGAEITASTLDQGDAGSVVIEADRSVKFDRGFASSQVNTEAVGNAGGVEIRANSLEVINGAQINASTLGQGKAGSVVIEATDLVKLDRGFASSEVNSGAVGNAG